MSTDRARLLFAFAVIYLVWGSTFLGVRFAVETMPPFLMAGMRFVVAGLVLLALSRKRASLLHWRNAAIAGAFFFFGNHSLITNVARILPSSVVALIIATEVPIIALLSSVMLPNRPLTSRTVLGSVIGLLGVAALFGDRTMALAVLPCLMALGASFSWSVGAVLSQRLSAPEDPMLRSGMQMLSGGLMLMLASQVSGEPFAPSEWSTRSLLSFLYCTSFGSVLAFACYQWLLSRVPTEIVATHVFVNPLVATALGAWLGGEKLGFGQLVAGVLIMTSVFVLTRRKPAPAEPIEELSKLRT